MKFLNILILLLYISQISYAQTASSREWTIFHKGLTEYNNGNYDLARQSFSLMISKLPNSMLTTANHLMLAKTNYKTADYQVSLLQCEEFKKLFPNSSYIDDINYLIGNNYYRLNRIETAVISWLNTGFDTRDEILREKALNLADDVINTKLNISRLEKLSEDNNHLKIKEAFKFHIAESFWQRGNISQARDQLEEIKSSGKTEHYKQKAEKLLSQSSNIEYDGNIIAALLPLSGVNEEVGKSLLMGFELALNEYNNTTSEKLVLMRFDYESNLMKALELMKQISTNTSIIAIYGPVENEITAACGSIADYEGITLISPTASSDKIISLSKNTIMLAPTVNTMARSIQSFIHDSLALKRVVTFSPIDDYYISMTNEFSEAQAETGGQIVAQEWYYPGDQNYKKQFRKMKRIGLKLEFEDSLRLEFPGIDDITIDSLYNSFVNDQRNLLRGTKTKVDSADIPVTTFDGMFIPIYAADISFVASQFAYSNFQTQLIGNSDWYDIDALKKNKNYINGILFVTDGYLNEDDWDFRQFRNNYRNTYKKTPGNYELISYDSFKFISQIFKNNPNISREDVLGKITRLKLYNGIYRSYNISSERINKSVRILKFIYGQIIPVQ